MRLQFSYWQGQCRDSYSWIRAGRPGGRKSRPYAGKYFFFCLSTTQVLGLIQTPVNVLAKVAGQGYFGAKFKLAYASAISTKNKTPWPESASQLYRPRDRRLSMKLVPAFAVRGCHVISVTDPYGFILGFLDRSRYFFFQLAPQLYSRG
jgi:hypothetical protein